MAGRPRKITEYGTLAQPEEETFLRVVRTNLKNSPRIPYIIERITVVKDKVVDRETVYGPDDISLVLPNAQLLLNPEEM